MMDLLQAEPSASNTGLMQRARSLVGFLGIAIALAASPAAGQDDSAGPALLTQRLTEEVATEGVLAYQAGAAPSRTEPVAEAMSERTRRAYRHVFLAFGIAWLLIFIYVMILGRRLSNLERDLTRSGAPRR